MEAAGGGTLFLDEVGELPRDLRPALLRVLDRRQVKRLGENHHRKVDVRVIAATNRDLCVEVNAGRFRADLYYRLAVLPIRLPALRERPDDLPLLVAYLKAVLDKCSGNVARSARAAGVRRSYLDRLLWKHGLRCVALQELRDYDGAMDLVGGDTLTRSSAVVKRGGIVVSIAGLPEPQTARKDLGRGGGLAALSSRSSATRSRA